MRLRLYYRSLNDDKQGFSPLQNLMIPEIHGFETVFEGFEFTGVRAKVKRKDLPRKGDTIVLLET